MAAVDYPVSTRTAAYQNGEVDSSYLSSKHQFKPVLIPKVDVVHRNGIVSRLMKIVHIRGYSSGVVPISVHVKIVLSDMRIFHCSRFRDTSPRARVERTTV